MTGSLRSALRGRTLQPTGPSDPTRARVSRVAHSRVAIGFVGESRARFGARPRPPVAPPSGELEGPSSITASTPSDCPATERCRAMEHQRKKFTASAYFVSLCLTRRERQPCLWKRIAFLCLALPVFSGFRRSVFFASRCAADGSGLAVVASAGTRCTRIDTPSQEL